MPQTHIPSSAAPSSFLTLRTILLACGVVMGLVGLWLLHQFPEFTGWDPSFSWKLSMVAALVSALLLTYRYTIVPLPSRLGLAAVLWAYVAIGIWYRVFLSVAPTLFLESAQGSSWLPIDLQTLFKESILGQSLSPERAFPQGTTVLELHSWFVFGRHVLLTGGLLLTALLRDETEEGQEPPHVLTWIVAYALLVALGIPSLVLWSVPPITVGAAHDLQEVVPLILAGFALLLLVRRTQWRTEAFSFGLLWMVLLGIFSIAYSFFAIQHGSNLALIGSMLWALGLTVPSIVMGAEMLVLYRASERYAWASAHADSDEDPVTDRELAQDLFKKVVKESQDAIYIIGDEERVLFTSNGFTALTGYTTRSAAGLTPERWTVMPKDGQSFSQLLATIRVRKTPFTADLWQKRAGGEQFKARIAVSPVSDQFGQVRWFVVRVQDLSTANQNALLLQQIFDNTQLGICLIEVPSGRIVHRNSYADVLFRRVGLSTVDVLSELTALCRTASGQVYAAERVPVAATMATKERAEQDDLVFADGKTGASFIWKMQSIPLFDAQAKLYRILVLFDDVTKEKETQRKMNDYVSIVAHQMRTPLTTMKWSVQQLKTNATMTPEDKESLLEDLEESTVGMYNVVERILELAKIENKNLEIRKQPTNLGEVINQVLTELKPRIEQKHLTVKQSTLRSLPLLNVDPILLQQVVLNLLDNAVRYSAAGGDIDSILTRENDGSVHWMLHDTGIGIAKDDLPSLFRKFTRAANAQKMEAYGMGIGLYLAKTIVDLFGGRISCDSEEQKGTTFHVILPA